jgi:4-diphosphocytidyl-2-C-methyl-D-erythritol kinase
MNPSSIVRVPTRPQVGLVKVRAHAKINLDLRVGTRRADGFHDLTTILQSIALHDTLTLRAVDGPCRVRCAASSVPEDESNLVWRAAYGLWSALGRRGAPSGVAITIAKRIPVAAGLGGGTADAIAALCGLCRLWDASAGPSLLREVAAAVGADGPFFLVGGTALGVGRGDHVYPLAELPRHWAVIAVPPRRVSTAVAYGWMDRDVAAAERRGRRRISRTRRLPPVAGSTLDLTSLVNDLERPVVRRRPEIRVATRMLDGAGALTAAMTGSGSAVFGLYTRRARAVQAAREVRRGGWIVCVTRTLDRAGLAEQAWV